MEQKKKQKWKMPLSCAFLVGLMAVTFYVVFKDNSIDDILRALATVNPWYIALGLLMAVGIVVFQGLALKVPMRSLGVRTGWGEFLGFSFVGIYFSGITPSSTGGQPMQLYYMRRRGIAMADASLSLLLANIAYQIVTMVYGLLMLALRFHFVSGAVRGMTALIIFGYAVAGLLLAGLFFVMFSKDFARRAVHGIIRLLGRLRILRDTERATASADKQIDDYTKGADIIRHRPRLFAGVLALTAAQVTCSFLIPFFVYKAFGLSGAGMMDLLAVQAILSIAVSYLPLPGAVGASEQGFVSMFAGFFTSATLVPAMLLSRGISFYALLIVSGIATAVMHLRTPKEIQEKDSGSALRAAIPPVKEKQRAV